MKELTIEHRGRIWNLKYQVFNDYDEYNGTYYWTEFYMGTETRTFKRFLFFGETITKTEPKMVFKVWKNIESVGYTKDQIRTSITHELDLLVRADEIAKGEIV